MENKLKDLENKQNEIDEKFERIEEVVSNIEKDIYSEEGFDFEIVCPYCNYEFVIDVDEEKTEVECPECKNTIELGKEYKSCIPLNGGFLDEFFDMYMI